MAQWFPLCRFAGEVYTCGLNARGQCGVAPFCDSPGSNRIRRVDTGSQRVLRLAASHACEQLLLVTADGGVLACGANNRGQLGVGHAVNVAVPTLVASMHVPHARPSFSFFFPLPLPTFPGADIDTVLASVS